MNKDVLGLWPGAEKVVNLRWKFWESNKKRVLLFYLPYHTHNTLLSPPHVVYGWGCCVPLLNGSEASTACQVTKTGPIVADNICTRIVQCGTLVMCQLLISKQNRNLVAELSCIGYSEVKGQIIWLDKRLPKWCHLCFHEESPGRVLWIRVWA